MNIISASNPFEALPNETIGNVFLQTDNLFTLANVCHRFRQLIHSDYFGNLLVKRINNILGEIRLVPESNTYGIPISIYLRLKKTEILAIRNFNKEVCNKKNDNVDLKDYDILSLPDTLNSARNESKINYSKLFLFVVGQDYSKFLTKMFTGFHRGREFNPMMDDQAFRLAAKNGHKETLKNLLNLITTHKFLHFSEALFEANKNGHKEVVKILFDFFKPYGILKTNFAFKIAAENGLKEVTNEILGNSETKHIAAEDLALDCLRSCLKEAAAKGKKEIVESSLEPSFSNKVSTEYSGNLFKSLFVHILMIVIALLFLKSIT